MCFIMTDMVLTDTYTFVDNVQKMKFSIKDFFSKCG